MRSRNNFYIILQRSYYCYNFYRQLFVPVEVSKLPLPIMAIALKTWRLQLNLKSNCMTMFLIVKNIFPLIFVLFICKYFQFARLCSQMTETCDFVVSWFANNNLTLRKLACIIFHWTKEIFSNKLAFLDN